MTEVTEVLAAILRGERAAAGALQALEPAKVLRTADEHGVLPLVANRLVEWESAGELLQSDFGHEYRRRAARDILRERELRRCLAEVASEGVSSLLMKGAQLAYTHYERPDLRSRVDTDLLIREADRGLVGQILERCGYESVGQYPGDLVMYQAPYTKRLGREIVDVIDVHWRIANPQLFGTVLSFEELADQAIVVSRLGPAVRGLSSVHALLLACVHRVAHHFDSDSLIWLYDIHLLASRLTSTEWTRFVELARARHVATVCLQGLERTARALHTAIPATVNAGLATAACAPADQATAAYLAQRRRHVQNVLADLRALPEWRSRWRLAMEHVFPTPAYMRTVYAPASGAPLPFLYMLRAMRGARKWLRRAQ